jgi:adenosylhomocysteine nucleosidase
VNDLLLDDPCLVFALPRESMGLRREFRPQEQFSGAPCWARFCGPSWLTVLVLHAGIGKQRVAETGDWLLSEPTFGNLTYRPKLVLMAGYTGGLCDRLAVGDVVLATEVMDQAGKLWPATWPAAPLEGEWQPPLHRGRLLTVDKIISAPEEKRRLGQQHGALAVDMESAVLAQLCSERGVPFGCVRVVSDAVDTPLSPHLARLFSGGKLSMLGVLFTLLRRPTLALEFWRLAKQTRRASDRLGQALGELLTLTL